MGGIYAPQHHITHFSSKYPPFIAISYIVVRALLVMLRHIYSKHFKKIVQLLTVISVTDKWFSHPPPMSK